MDIASGGLRCPVCRSWHGPQLVHPFADRSDSSEASPAQKKLAKSFANLSASGQKKFKTQEQQAWFGESASNLVQQALGYMYQCQFDDAPVKDEIKFINASISAAHKAGQRDPALRDLDAVLTKLRSHMETTEEDAAGRGTPIPEALLCNTRESVLAVLKIHTEQPGLEQYGGSGTWSPHIFRWMSTLGILE
mmetsp:Transcript_48713/g.96442  ORF Transcript_48713/g.96442 Transcript_48713/m.96442 type:complete len:192 (+) Transcript_48713:450-1025(+)